MTEAPYVRAAFINALAEEGTRAEILAFLQAQWNECCALRAEAKQWKERHDLVLRKHMECCAAAKTLADYTDAELSDEADRRMRAFVGDPIKGVSLP